MGGKGSKTVVGDVTDSGSSVIDKLTEAQLDEFREAFNSFDKVRCPCRPCRPCARPLGDATAARSGSGRR